MNFANTTAEMKKFDEAMSAVDKAFSINPDFQALWNVNYKVHIMKGGSESDLANIIENVKEIDSPNIPIYAILTHYYKNRDETRYAKTLSEWKEFVATKVPTECRDISSTKRD